MGTCGDESAMNLGLQKPASKDPAQEAFKESCCDAVHASDSEMPDDAHKAFTSAKKRVAADPLVQPLELSRTRLAEIAWFSRYGA
jgi:hypothetical protein